MTMFADVDSLAAAGAMDDEAVDGEVRVRSWEEIDADIGEVLGQVNALNGRLVGLVAEGLAIGIAQNWVSPQRWLAWRGGMTDSRAGALVALAQRQREIPVTVEALQAGRLSVDQVAPIARCGPSWADRDLAQMAESMTPPQVARCARMFAVADEANPANDPHDEPVDNDPADNGGNPENDSNNDNNSNNDDDGNGAKAAAEGVAQFWFDDDGRWHGHLDLPADDGLLIDAALRAHLDGLWNERTRQSGGGDERVESSGPMPTWTEAFMRMAERSLDTEAARRSHHQRCKVLVHVDLDAEVGRGHLGPWLPAGLWRWLACDATWQTVYERDGVALGVGRIKNLPQRLRTMVEHRDHGCRVPGCSARYVQVHHVVHRGGGHDGLSETWNLIALCPRHHRMHHMGGRLGIHGTNADDPTGITFTDHAGRRIGPVGRPRPPTGTVTPPCAATYRPPEGGHLNLYWVTPQPPWERTRSHHEPPPAPDPGDGDAPRR